MRSTFPLLEKNKKVNFKTESSIIQHVPPYLPSSQEDLLKSGRAGKVHARFRELNGDTLPRNNHVLCTRVAHRCGGKHPFVLWPLKARAHS